MSSFDIAIAGAGPAGSALAIHLARAGLRVLLLERARFPRDKICGDYIGPRGLAELHELGVLEALCEREQPLPLSSASIYVDGALSDSGRMPMLAGYPGFALAIARSALDEALFRRAQVLGVTTCEDCSVQAFEITRSGVAIDTLSCGRAQRFEARIIVGADGAQSRVARSAGLELADADHTMVTLRGYVRGANIDTSKFYFARDFFPGFGWVFPVRAGVVNVGVGMLKSALLRDGIDLRAFYARLTQFVQTLAPAAHALAIEPPRGWMIKTYGSVRARSFERGLLVGEAAGLVDPISGEGIAHALESARFAADTLQRAFDAGEFSAARLADYDALCDARWDLDLSLADWVVTVIKNRQLRELWMGWMHLLGRLTSSDRYFATTLGGVLAGVVPTRDAFSPSTMLRAWFRISQMVGLDALSTTQRPQGWLQRASEWMRVQDRILVEITSDPNRFRDWALEVQTKQLTLARRWPEVWAPSAWRS